MSGENSHGSLGSAPIEPSRTEQKAFAFVGPAVINKAALLAQSASGNSFVHKVDIDIKATATAAGVSLDKGAGAIFLNRGASEEHSGTHLPNNILEEASEFTLTLVAGDEARIHWVEVV